MKKIIVGLTGQTGAGKTTVCDYAGTLGCAVVNADRVAREALSPGSDCLKKLANFFGYDIIDEDGNCKRSLLAQRAFSSREKTDLLNSITHPWIIRKSREYIRNYLNKNYDIAIFDAPQLFESGGDSFCDIIISVVAPEKVRLNRIMGRDGIDETAAVQRIKAQHDESYYTTRSDYVIDGGESLESVCTSFLRIYEEIKKHIEKG